MDLFATGASLQPGLPARNGDAASESERTDETAIFEAFLGLALSVPSPDAVIVPGPEGKTAAAEASFAALEATGNPATAPGKSLPVLPVLPLEAQASIAEQVAAMPSLKGMAFPQAAPNLSVDGDGDAAPLARQVAALAQATIPALPAPVAIATEAARSIDAAQQASPVIAVLVLRQRDLPLQNATATEAVAEKPSDPEAEIDLAVSNRTVAGAALLRPEPVRPAALTPVADPAAQSAAPAPAAPELSGGSGKTEARDAAPRAASQALADQPEGAPAMATSPEASLAALVEPRGVQPVQPTGNAGAKPIETGAQQFGDIVDRLARAREAEAPDMVQSSLATREFGTVAMQLRAVEGRLHVAMTSADPGFAPAVQAASAVAGSSQQALSDSPPQQQGQQSSQASASSHGQTGPENQTRQQQPERSAASSSAQAPSDRIANEPGQPADPRGTADGAIYA